MFGGKRKLRKVALNAFGGDQEDSDEGDDKFGDIAEAIGSSSNKKVKQENNVIKAHENTAAVQAGTVTAAVTAEPVSAAEELSPGQLEVIIKTALWVANNPTQAHLLQQKAEGNATLSFLLNPVDSAAGRRYLQELDRIKVEREVRSVCGADIPTMTAPQHHQQQQQQYQSVGINSSSEASDHISKAVHVQSSGNIAFSSVNAATASTATAATCAAGATVVTDHRTTCDPQLRRRNKWGPPMDPIASTSATSYAAAATVMDKAMVTANADQYSNNKSRRIIPKKRSKAEEEQAQIAALAATFDDYDQSEDSNGYYGPTVTQTVSAAASTSYRSNYNSCGGGSSIYNDDISGGSVEHNSRMQKLMEEQKELQLLESKIREAAQQQMSHGSEAQSRLMAQQLAEELGNGNCLSAASAAMLAEPQAELYLERLRQYKELSSIETEENYRDTIEEAERNGGVIDGGTWEHRKRAKEMLDTAALNLQLSLAQRGAGSRHMGEYMPKEVLQKFLKKAEAVKSGGKVEEAEEEFAAHKLDSGNMGFQLLQKSGWKEGSGLGATGSGITAPIGSAHSSSSNTVAGLTIEAPSGPRDRAVPRCPTAAAAAGVGAAVRGPEGGGVGTAATYEVEAADSEFDQYRKRMMLAYRFRPNPLNNPRRNYY